MAFDLYKRNPEGLEAALSQSIVEKQERDEKPVTFGYDRGTPMRFAMDKLRGQGLSGEFGQLSMQPSTQRYLRDYVYRMSSGPFALPIPGMAPPSQQEA